VKKILLSILMLAMVSAPAGAEKVAVGKYHTKAPIDKVFMETIETVPMVEFVVRQENKEQGTIQANRLGSNGYSIGERASLFIIVSKEEGGVCIEATFSKHVGMGSPDKWATDFGSALKKELPDLTFEVQKR
jgi:hypothetical protein